MQYYIGSISQGPSMKENFHLDGFNWREFNQISPYRAMGKVKEAKKGDKVYRRLTTAWKHYTCISQDGPGQWFSVSGSWASSISIICLEMQIPGFTWEWETLGVGLGDFDRCWKLTTADLGYAMVINDSKLWIQKIFISRSCCMSILDMFIVGELQLFSLPSF